MSDRVNANAKYGVGDTGFTLVAPGVKASKADLVVELFGITDECNAKAGWVIHQLQKCKEYSCIYEESKIREITELLMNSINNLAAVVYSRSDIDSYIPNDKLALEKITGRIEEIKVIVGNADEFTHIGYSGEMELVLNDFRVILRALERCVVKLQQSHFKEHTFLNRYLSLFNRASLWAYWEARLAGKLYRLHHVQNGDSKLLKEQYWKNEIS
jgi:cob(I)alamin adenosyltransferase